MIETDIDLVDILQGEHIGFYIGVPGIGLTATPSPNTEDNTAFTAPDECLPAYDLDGAGPPADKDDITLYADGTEVTLTSFDPKTGAIVATSAPGVGDVMTIDCVQEWEPYVAQTLGVTPDYDSTEVGRIHSSVKRTIYGARSITIDLSLLMGNIEWLTMFFKGASVSPRIMKPEPPEIHCYVVIERANVIEAIVYFPYCRMIPKKMFDVKQGDTVSYDLEITVSKDPILWENPLA